MEEPSGGVLPRPLKPARGSGRRRWGVALGVLGLVLTLAVGVLAGWVWVQFGPPEGFVQDRVFQVRSNEPLVSIASRLEQEGVIRSGLLLRLLAWVRGTERRFQKGEYLLRSRSSLWDIHQQITSGRQLLIRVTLVEGWTSRKMAQALEAKEIVRASDFLEAIRDPQLLVRWSVPFPSLEGLLYPDTYLFPRHTEATTVVQVLVDRFFEVLGSVGGISARRTGAPDWDKIILASIIEREYRIPEEAPLISSVFHNRLRLGIPLASCATVEYIITEIQGRPHPKRIFFSDTEIPSPYNTYLKPGLPPGPIANPGRIALEAAFRPAETDYLFFVVKDPAAGTHTFSRTISDHLAAREAYLERYVPKD